MDTNSQNIVNLGLYHFNLTGVTHFLNKFPAIRNIHGDHNVNLIPMIIYANELAKSINSSLFPIPNYASVNSNTSIPEVPTLLKDLALTEEETYDLAWLKFWNLKKTKLPNIAVAESFPLNFAYCEDIKHKYESSWELDIFTSPLDPYCWIGLIAGLFLTAIIVSFKNKLTFSSTFLITISSLLSSGASGITSKSDKSVQLVSWMLLCLLVSNLYQGEVTSRIIRPPLPETVDNVDQLIEKNYTLIYPNEVFEVFARKFVTLTNDPFENLKTNIISELPPYSNFLLQLATNRSHQAFMQSWPLTVLFAIKGNKLLEEKKIIDKRRCHVGKEIVPVNSIYYAFLPPKQDKLFTNFQRLFQAGVHKRWIDETIGLSHSARVQDRSKILGPAKTVEETLPAVALKMDTRTLKLFLAWIIGTVTSAIVFAGEQSTKISNLLLYYNINSLFIS